MEMMLVNLRLLGVANFVDRDLAQLKRYSETVARTTNTTIPPNYPIVGRDAFRTQTGVHAAAIAKAFKHDDPELADTIYSGVPAHLFGLEQVIEVGPMSGRSNIVYWLAKRAIPASDEIIDRIFAAAKQSDSVLTEQQILSLVASSARH
jgi:2-isopropylmalate synthase